MRYYTCADAHCLFDETNRAVVQDFYGKHISCGVQKWRENMQFGEVISDLKNIPLEAAHTLADERASISGVIARGAIG